MTKQELTQLRELLEKFINWMDDRDSKSIATVKSFKLAEKLYEQHTKNTDALSTAKTMVRAMELNPDH